MANIEEYILKVDAEVSAATSKLDRIVKLMDTIDRIRTKGRDDYFSTNQKDMDKNMRSMKELTMLYRDMEKELDNIQRSIRETSENIKIPDDVTGKAREELRTMKATMDAYANNIINQQRQIQAAYNRTLGTFRELASFQQNYSRNYKHLFSSNDLYNLPNRDKRFVPKDEADRMTKEELSMSFSKVRALASEVDDVTDRFNNVVARLREVNKLDRRTESLSRRASASGYMSYQQATSFMKDKQTVESDYKKFLDENLQQMVRIGRDRTQLHRQVKEIEENPLASQEDIDRKIAYQREIEALDKEFEKRIELNKALERTIANMRKYNESVQGIEVKPERGTIRGMMYERAPAIGLAMGGAMAGVVGGLYHQGAGLSRAMRDDEISIGQRTDTAGSLWRESIRNAALDAGLQDRLGFTGQEMLAFQNNYLSRHGFTSMEDLNTAMQSQAVFSRVSGVSAQDTNQFFSTLFGTGAVKGSQVKDIQDAFIGAIKRSGMEGREKEQLQALDEIIATMSQGRELTNQQVMNTVGLQTILAETGNRALQGASGGAFMNSLDQGIKAGFDNPMIRLLYGQGTKYQGLGGRWALRKQLGKGISDINNVTTAINYASQVGGSDPNAQKESLASLFDAMDIQASTQQIEGIWDLYQKGQLTQENLNKVISESSATGSKVADERLKNYQESSAATDNQSEATTQKHATKLYDFGEVIREANAAMANLNTTAYVATAALAGLAVAAAATAGSFVMAAGVRSLAAGTMTSAGASRGLLGRIPMMFGRGGGTPPSGGRTYSSPGGWQGTIAKWFGGNPNSIPNPGPSGSAVGSAAAGEVAGAGSSLGKFFSGAGKVLSKAALPLSVLFGIGHVATAEEGTKGKATGEALGGILGGLGGGAAAGAAIGSIVPGIGTAIGGIIGGIAGGFAGSGIGGWIGEKFDPKKDVAKSENKVKEMTDKETTNTKARTETKKTDNLQYERENLHIYESLLDRTAQLLQQARSQGGIFGLNGGVGGTGMATGAGTLAGNTNAEKIWNFFAEKGLSSSAIAGILGNLQQESGLNPNSPGGGLAQWIGGRKSNLDAFARQRGLDPNSLEAQLQFMWHEMNGGDSTFSNKLKSIGGLSAFNSMSPSQAAEFFSKYYERPGKPMLEKRKQYANDFYNQFGSAQFATTSATKTSTSNNNVRVNSTITVNVRGDESVSAKVNNSSEMKKLGQTIQNLIYGATNYYSKEMRQV